MGMSEIIQKMKIFLQNEIPAEEVQMTDVKTKDGIILSFEGELAPGIEIFIVDETGKNPASDGEYILEDGQTIIVAEGKVAEVKMPEDPIEEPETEEIEVIPAEEVQMTDVKTKGLAPGIEIFDETGKNPASDGEYILEDGRTIIVAEGKVAEVKMPEDPIEEPETEEALPVAEMAEEPVVEKPKEEDDRIKKLEDEILQIKSILSELVTEMGKTELKEEIKQDLKLSKVNTVPKMRENNNIANSQLDNIFYNMYNKKL